MWEYLQRRPEKILVPLIEHIELVVITLVISLVIASFLSLLALRFPKLQAVFDRLFTIIYSIPSLALFVLMIPVTGLGQTTAIIVLTLYNQYLLIKNFTTGINEVDPSIVEAAKGIGMDFFQILTKVQIPLAKRSLFAGIRLAVVSTIGIGTIAASINAGGLGTLLFDGLRTMNLNKIYWGVPLSAGLAIVMNGLLKVVENKC